MGRSIPVKRPDNSDVASEQGLTNLGGGKSLADIVTSLGGKTLANVYDAITDLKGTSGKTLTDVVSALGSKTLADIWQAVGDLKGAGGKTMTDIVTALGGLPAARGATTSANSLSITPATDAVVVVAGKAAVGEAPTVNPVGVAGTDGNNLKRSVLVDNTGRIVTTFTADAIIPGTIGALNEFLTLQIPQGAQSVAFRVPAGTLSGTISILCSSDLFVAESLPLGCRFSAAASTFQTTFSLAGGPSTGVLMTNIPPGVNAVQLKCTAYTSGSATVSIAVSSRSITDGATVGATLQAGTARVGFLAAPGIWTRESTTPVNANQTITGAAKTTFNSSSGAALASLTSYGRAFAAAAGADVAGTLVIDASPDSGATWYPLIGVALTQIGGSGNFGAYIEGPICEATMRARLVNGGTNQTRTYLTTRMLG